MLAQMQLVDIDIPDMPLSCCSAPRADCASWSRLNGALTKEQSSPLRFESITKVLAKRV